MGITGLIPFLEKASRRANVGEFNGCTVAIDSYCWLHKGAFACADKLVQGLETDIYVKYCLKYVTMLLSKNIKPIMVFDGRHLPAKAMTELKRRESRQLSKKRAAELLSLGQMEEARSYMRRSVDVTHEMALALIKECRNRNVDCIVAPYEADAQLAYLNINNIAQLVITEDSDLILFGCTKVLFKMDLDGTGTLVETAKLPLVMKCAIESYTFDKFRQMCIMSGCDYLASLPGIGLAKARQFVVATQDPNFANENEYRENFLKAEATFKHQYVYDPLERRMVRLTEIDDEDPKIAYQLALGNLDPFSLKKMDDWDPDNRQNGKCNIKSSGWYEKPSNHPSIWNEGYRQYLEDPTPWLKKIKKLEPIIAIPQTRIKKKVVNLVSKYVPETQDISLTIESLSSMYCEPSAKKQKNNITHNNEETESQKIHNIALTEDEILDERMEQNKKSPIIESRKRLNRKFPNNSSFSVLKRLSKFPRTVLGDNLIESKFFASSTENNINENLILEESPKSENLELNQTDLLNNAIEIDTQCSEIPNSLKENSPISSPVKCKKSPILEPKYKNRNPFKKKEETQLSSSLSDDSVIDNTYPMENLVTPVDTQDSFGESQPQISPISLDKYRISKEIRNGINGVKKSSCKVSGLKRTTSLPSNQPTLLSKFGFQKKPVLKK
ncbi:Exonuclease 1 [Papilio xuthus]|uniref:Exonuclease 1 n=1 Tax=Papilio xuthus TaxID=66420 RepID=A0A194PEI8_PAPXU|nr:Exonuclease 1 [Papilio xuthus]